MIFLLGVAIIINYLGHQRNLAMPLGKNHLKEIGRYGRLLLLKYLNKWIVRVYLRCYRVTAVNGKESRDHLIK